MTIKKIGLSALLFSAVLLTAGAATQVQAHAATGDSTIPTTKTTTDSSDPATHGVVTDAPYAVWTTLPAGSTVSLDGPAGYVYALFNDQGASAQRGLAGDSGWTTDQLELSLKPRNAANSINYDTSGLFVRVSTDEWVKVVGHNTFGTTLNAGDSSLEESYGGLNPTNLVINFTDQNGKAAQAPLVLPISTPQYNGAYHTDEQPSTLGQDITNMVHTLQADLAQTHYDIPGYTLRDDATVTSDGFTTTIHYIKDADPAKPSGGGNNTTSSSSSSESGAVTADKPATKPVAVKGEAVYATKAIGLYQTPNFTQATRKHFYTKESRTERPQFVVTGYARTKNGALRYKVRDVNHTKATDKLRGYITADDAYVDSTYYQTTPKTIKVLNRHGLNAYKDADLTGKSLHHYTRGTVLKVKASQAYHLANRFVLPNGHYVSANKVLVVKK